ncbi:MAG: hypothetical protein HOW73_03520 [Polyangiaceae bacterium]|nr:hypothetical protein [Polyangiaceae bacterium]
MEIRRAHVFVALSLAAACGDSSATNQGGAGGSVPAGGGPAGGGGETNSAGGAGGAGGALGGGGASGGGGEGPTEPVNCRDGWCWVNPQPDGNHLKAVAASGPDDVWIGGEHGALFHWNGAEYSRTNRTYADITDILVPADDDVWVAASDSTLHFDGQTWNDYADVVDHFIGVLEDGTPIGRRADLAFHFDSGEWQEIPPPLAGSSLLAAWGSSTSDLYVVDTEGRVSHLDVNGWAAVTTPLGVTLDYATVLPDGAVVATDSQTTSPPSATGTIYGYVDGSWGVVATFNQPSQATFKMYGTAVDDLWRYTNSYPDVVRYHWDGATWSTSAAGSYVGIGQSPAQVEDVAVAGGVVWEVGGWGRIQSFDGTTTTSSFEQVRPTLPNAYHSVEHGWTSEVWGFGSDDIWITADDRILHFDGTVWMASEPNPDDAELHGIWGATPDELWVVGVKQKPGRFVDWLFDQYLYRYDGPTLVDRIQLATSSTADLRGVWGTDQDNVWAWGFDSAAYVGAGYHYDGTTWSADSSGRMSYTGSGTNDLWALGPQATIQHFDGTEWATFPLLTDYPVGSALWYNGPGDVYALNGGVGTEVNGVQVVHSTGGPFANLPTSGNFIAGTAADDVFAWGPQGITRWTDPTGQDAETTGAIADAPYSAWRAPDGRIWFVTPNGILYREPPLP